MESVLVRMGSCFPEPSDQRSLSLWFSYPDVARLMIACRKAEKVGCKVIWGVSNNSRRFCGNDDRQGLDWAPQDSADAYADRLLGKVGGNPIAAKYQGGICCDRG